MDDWTIYGLVKYHLENLRLMLEWCRQHQIALNSKKCIFCAPFGILLGHIVCKEGLLVDPMKIALILSLPLSTNVNMLCATMGHMGYYHKFIRGYTTINAPLEKLLKKDIAFEWTPECQGSFYC